MSVSGPIDSEYSMGPMQRQINMYHLLYRVRVTWLVAIIAASCNKLFEPTKYD